MRAIKSAFFWLYLGLSAAVLFHVALLIWLCTRPFDARLSLLHRFTCWWGYHYVQVCPFWYSTISGREKILDHTRYVLVANHLSLGDILMLFGVKKHFKWVSKSSVFKVPFIGWNMWLNNYVGLKRGDRKSVVLMFKACRAHLEQGSSMLLFPEGTRSADGQLKPFKLGAFSLAIQQKVSVVPLVLHGTHQALPKSSWVFPHKQALKVSIEVLDPINPATLGAHASPAKALMQLTHQRMQEAIERRASSTGDSA